MLWLRIQTLVEHSLITCVALGVMVFVAGTGSMRPAHADDNAPELGLSHERNIEEPPETLPLQYDHGLRVYYRWGYYPWYKLPPTIREKAEDYKRGRTGYVPRLGLWPHGRYAWQMGHRIPVDHAPLRDSGGPTGYRGVVGETLSRVHSERLLHGHDNAIELMKVGKYRRAGLELARGFQRHQSARYPLLLTEVFVALEKHKHAEFLLETALESEGVERYLPADISSHFKDEVTFEKLIGGVKESGEPLLSAYFLLHSKTPDAGLEVLLTLMTKNPDDRAANTLYRHYLSHLFQKASAEK